MHNLCVKHEEFNSKSILYKWNTHEDKYNIELPLK